MSVSNAPNLVKAGSPADMAGWGKTMGNVAFTPTSKNSSTLFSANYYGFTYVFEGTGFTYNSAGTVTGGTIANYQQYSLGGQFEFDYKAVYGGSPFGAAYYQFQSLGGTSIATAPSATSYYMQGSDGSFTQVVGSGFTYGAGGSVTGGVVQNVNHFASNGQILETVSGMSTAAVNWMAMSGSSRMSSLQQYATIFDFNQQVGNGLSFVGGQSSEIQMDYAQVSGQKDTLNLTGDTFGGIKFLSFANSVKSGASAATVMLDSNQFASGQISTNLNVAGDTAKGISDTLDVVMSKDSFFSASNFYFAPSWTQNGANQLVIDASANTANGVTILGAQVNETINAGSGQETIMANVGLAKATVNGGVGGDTISSGSNASYTKGVASGSANIIGKAAVGMTDTLNAGGGNDILDGRGARGTENLNGGWGSVTEYGGAGTNNFNAGSGAATIYGGAGANSYNMQSQSSTVTATIVGSSGADKVIGGSSSLNYTAGSGLANITTGSGAGVYNMGATSHAADVINGAASGSSTVNASADARGLTFTGGWGKDAVHAGAGADTMNLGTGFLQAWGGAGANMFNVGSAGTLEVMDWSTNDTVSFNNTLLHNFADVLSHATYDSKANMTTISSGAGSMLELAGVNLKQLTAAEFKFA